MAKKNPKIDTYIKKSADFAVPVLMHLRDLVHKACPDVEETIKWGMPSFDYKGPYCSMAAFKQHAVFGFWKAALMKDPKRFLQARSTDGGSAMGHFGKITGIHDLPPNKVILDLLKQAKKLNDEGIKLPGRPKSEKRDIVVPAYFMNALKTNKKALETFKAFSYSNKKDYVEWITEAKTEATREKRMETALDWIAEGKVRNWKYLKK